MAIARDAETNSANGKPAVSHVSHPSHWELDAELECEDHPPPEFEPILQNCGPSTADGLMPLWPLPCPSPSSSSWLLEGRVRQLCRGHAAPLAVFEHWDAPVLQHGPRPLTVCWMGDVGWGVRSSQELPVGSFVCEYTGELLPDAEAESLSPGRDAYLFNLTTPEQCRGLGAQVDSGGEEQHPVYVIDAYVKGNVGRFLNHACGPSNEANVSPTYVFVVEKDADVVDAKLPRVAFFANRNIAPGEELRYDYGMPPEAVLEADGRTLRHQQCLCGSRACRGRIY